MVKLKPIHPGEILREEFMAPLHLNGNKLALALHVPAPTVYDIVHEGRGISPEMALRLGRFFRTTPDFLAQPSIGVRFADRAQPKRSNREESGLPAR
jgi:addiction module HigA family antidote